MKQDIVLKMNKISETIKFMENNTPGVVEKLKNEYLSACKDYEKQCLEYLAEEDAVKSNESDIVLRLYSLETVDTSFLSKLEMIESQITFLNRKDLKEIEAFFNNNVEKQNYNQLISLYFKMVEDLDKYIPFLEINKAQLLISKKYELLFQLIYYEIETYGFSNLSNSLSAVDIEHLNLLINNKVKLINKKFNINNSDTLQIELIKYLIEFNKPQTIKSKKKPFFSFLSKRNKKLIRLTKKNDDGSPYVELEDFIELIAEKENKSVEEIEKDLIENKQGDCIYAKYDWSDVIVRNKCFRKYNLSNTNINVIVGLTIGFDGMNLKNIYLGDISFNEKRINNTNFEGTEARINPQRIENKNLSGTNLKGLDLSNADFTDVNIQGTILEGTNANIDLLKLRIAYKYGDAFIDLRGTSFRGIDLSKNDFSIDSRSIVFIITNTDFTNTNLKFKGIHLYKPVLYEPALGEFCVILTGCKFQSVDFSYYNFENIDISNSDFRGSNLYGANFYKAIGLEKAIFSPEQLADIQKNREIYEEYRKQR